MACFSVFLIRKVANQFDVWFATGPNCVANCDADPHKYNPACGWFDDLFVDTTRCAVIMDNVTIRFRYCWRYFVDLFVADVNGITLLPWFMCSYFCSFDLIALARQLFLCMFLPRVCSSRLFAERMRLRHFWLLLSNFE